MKPRFEGRDGGQSDNIRSDIAQTRIKMDHTLDEISRRLTPRHLLDEFLEMFRSHAPDKQQAKDKVSAAVQRAGDTASHVGRALGDVIREHPVPTLLIGAGMAWAFYESKSEQSGHCESGYESEEDMNYETSMEQERQGISGQMQEKLATGAESVKSQLKTAREKGQEKLSDKGQQLRSKTGQLRERAAERGRRMRATAGELSERVGDRTRRAYSAGRERFLESSQAHPLSTGLGFLAIGLLAGLALPSTRTEDEWVGRTSDKLKHRAREEGQAYVERGREVVSAATTAAKEEARQQGLTTEGLKQKAKEVASQARTAAEESARQEEIRSEPGMPEQKV